MSSMLGVRIEDRQKLSAPRPHTAMCCLSGEKSNENRSIRDNPFLPSWDTRTRTKIDSVLAPSVVIAPSLQIPTDGTLHLRTLPVKWKISINNASGKKEWSLLDDCSSLSIMSREMHQKYFSNEELNTSRQLDIFGVGETRSLGYLVTSIFAESTDGRRVQFDVEFHVVPNFAPGFCVGVDMMNVYKLDTLISEHRAHLKSLKAKFPIFFDRGTQKQSKMTCHADTVIPPRSHKIIKVDWKVQVNADHFVTPVITTRSPTETFGMIAKSIVSYETNSIVYSNFGLQPIHLKKGEKVGQAVPIKADDRCKDIGEVMNLDTNNSSSYHYSATKDELCKAPPSIPEMDGDRIAVLPDSQDRSPEPHTVKPSYKVFDVGLNDLGISTP